MENRVGIGMTRYCKSHLARPGDPAGKDSAI